MLLDANGSVVAIEPVTFDPMAGIDTYEDFLAAAAAQVLTAAGTYPMPVSHPFGPPTVSGTSITVEAMLAQPTRITRMIMDLTRQRFIADQIFANGGGVTGGAVVFDSVQKNELYTNRDVEQVEPAAEFPLVTSDQVTPDIATVEKWGGKTFITDEARDRNDSAGFTKLIRQLANTIVRKLNQRAIATLEAAIADNSRNVIGNNWATYNPEVDAPNKSPAYDFGRAQMQADNEEMGMDLTLWLVNPQEMLSLQAIYGPTLSNPIMPRFYSSPRITAGTALAIAPGQVGQMRIEKPLSSATWREEKTERTWAQSSVRPLWFVDNKFAILRFTGLAG